LEFAGLENDGLEIGGREDDGEENADYTNRLGVTHEFDGLTKDRRTDTLIANDALNNVVNR